MNWIGERRRKISKVQGLKKVTEYLPVVRAIQAEVAKAGEVANAIIGVAEQVREFIPTMQIITKSFCDNIAFISGFTGFALAAKIAANLVVTYQGDQAVEKIAAHLKDIGDSLAAQTALVAQEAFARKVYKSVYQSIDQTAHDVHQEHWFFVYHPDTDWYSAFHWKIAKKRLKKNFCGYSNQLDSVVIFMLAARTELEKERKRAMKHGKPTRDVIFHLLIPAYRPLVITEPLLFPQGLGAFVVQGEIHNSQKLVWLNLPEEQERLLYNIGNWKPPPPSVLESIGNAFGVKKTSPERSEPRILGTIREDMGSKREDSRISGGGDDSDDGSDGGDVVLYDAASRSTSRSRHTHHKTKSSRSSDISSLRRQSKSRDHTGSIALLGSTKRNYPYRHRRK